MFSYSGAFVFIRGLSFLILKKCFAGIRRRIDNANDYRVCGHVFGDVGHSG
jgi:hypothetical protein